MSLMPLLPSVPSKFLIALLNSNFLFDYYREFINCTVNVQINDLRQIPVIIPSLKVLEEFISLTNIAIDIKKSVSLEDETDSIQIEDLSDVEIKIDNMVEQLYLI